MKTIVFIGTHKSGSSRDAIKAAKRMGFYTVLITDLPRQINQRIEYDDVDSMIYCKNDLNKMMKLIKDLQANDYEILAIVGFVDPHCETANRLAEQLGLNHFTIEAIHIMQDKFKSRKVLENSDYIPNYITISDPHSIKEKELIHLLPAILKYPQSQGSKDVYLVKNVQEYQSCINKLLERYPNGSVIFEEYLDGPQYLVETLVIKEVIHIVAIVEQEVNYLNGHFIVTGYNVMINPNEEFEQELKTAVEDIIRLHGLKNGPCHLELRYVKNQWKLIEINPRISGAGMNTLLETAFGICLVEETLKLLLNKEVGLTPKYKIHTFAEYLTVSETGTLDKITGRNRAMNCDGVKCLFIKPKKGSVLIPPISMGNRYAYVIATGENEIAAKENAKYAASKINFILKPIEE